MISVSNSLCSGIEWINHERLPSEKKSKLTLPQSILYFDDEKKIPSSKGYFLHNIILYKTRNFSSM